MRAQRHNFTLLETLLALSLTAILLSVTTFFFHQMDTSNRQYEKMVKESFKMRYIENRLMHVLPKTQPIKERKDPAPRASRSKKNNEDFFFFTTHHNDTRLFGKGEILIFTFDNGMKLDKEFSNDVIGCLYLDEKKRLCLATWPAPSRWSLSLPPNMKKEILMTGVESLAFSFFAAPDRQWKAGVEEQQNSQALKPNEGWQPTWSQDYRELPSLIKIHVGLDAQQKKTFAFPIISANRQIVYKNVDIEQ